MKHILWLVNYYKNTVNSKHNQHFLAWHFGLYRRPSSAKVCLILLPVLATIVMRRGKKSLLVHPKDKQEKEEITDCVHKIPCASCEKCYIGETERKFGTRLKEYKTGGIHN